MPLYLWLNTIKIAILSLSFKEALYHLLCQTFSILTIRLILFPQKKLNYIFFYFHAFTYAFTMVIVYVFCCLCVCLTVTLSPWRALRRFAFSPISMYNPYELTGSLNAILKYLMTVLVFSRLEDKKPEESNLGSPPVSFLYLEICIP